MLSQLAPIQLTFQLRHLFFPLFSLIHFSFDHLLILSQLCYNSHMPDIKRIHYYVMCVSAFAETKELSQKDAYNYLEKYKGLEFLMEHYEAEHLLSLDDAVDDLTTVCKNNGGEIE